MKVQQFLNYFASGLDPFTPFLVSGRIQLSETAKHKILNGTEGSLVIHGDAPDFLKKCVQQLRHGIFRISFDFDAATFFRSLFRKGPDNQNPVWADTFLGDIEVVGYFLLLGKKMKSRPVVPKVVLFVGLKSGGIRYDPFHH